VLDPRLDDVGAVLSAKVIRVHPCLKNIETTLGIIVHEGRHALDIQAGLVPEPRKANAYQRLLAEARAWASELEFLRRNEFNRVRDGI
jgi:hypothetical protein